MLRFLIISCTIFVINLGVIAQSDTITTTDNTRYSEAEAFEEEKFISASTLRLANRPKEAIPILQGLIKENKSEPAFYYELARTYYLDKQMDEALMNATKSVSLAPANLYYRIFEAEILEKQGNAEMAAVKYEDIIAKHPRVEEYYLKLSKLYNASGNSKKAVETFDRMASKLGTSEEIMFRKFQTQMDMEDKAGAIKTLEESIKLYPDNLQFKNTLASVFKNNGREEDAKKLYDEVLAADPENVRANIALAEGLKKDKQDGKYLNSIASIIENPQISIDSKIGEILPFVNKYIETQDSSLVQPLAKIAGQLAKAHPQEAKAWAVAGDIRLHLGMYSEALSAYDEALKLTQKVYSVFEQKMLLLTYLKRYETLVIFCNEALDIYPNQINNFINLAFAQLKLGHPDQAISTLSTAELMTGNNHPQSAVIHAMLAISYAAGNDKEKSGSYFQKADILSKGNVSAMSHVAGMLAEFGLMLDMARAKIDASTVKNSSDPFNAATVSLIEFKEKNYTSSMKWIETAIANGGLKYPSIAEQAGDVYFMSKNISKAIEMWTLAKSMGVNSATLDKKLASKSYIQ